jgi:hypothetical protein
MEKQDTRRLFSLIETIYPNAKQQSRTAADLEAWTLVLAPWDYEDVKQAVIVRARENRFYPDVYELVPFLPKLERPNAEEAPMPEPSNAYLEKFYAKAGEQHERWHEAGIPTPSEAKKQGMTYAEWCALADMRGV